MLGATIPCRILNETTNTKQAIMLIMANLRLPIYRLGAFPDILLEPLTHVVLILLHFTLANARRLGTSRANAW